MIIMVGFKRCTEWKHICGSTPIYPSDNIRFMAGDKSTLAKMKALASASGVKSTNSVSGQHPFAICPQLLLLLLSHGHGLSIIQQ